jgi:hypothetical protein
MLAGNGMMHTGGSRSLILITEMCAALTLNLSAGLEGKRLEDGVGLEKFVALSSIGSRF